MPPPARSTAAGAAAVVAAAALFGTSGTARALLVPDSWPPGVAAVRLGIGALGLVAFAWYRGLLAPALSLLRSPVLWLCGIAVAGYQGMFFIGVEWTGVAVGTLVSLGLAPLMAGLLGWAVGEGPPGWPWAGVTLVAVAGLALLTLAGSTSVDPRGVTAALAAGICYSVYTVFGTRLVRDGSHPTAVMTAAFGTGAVLVSPFLLGVGDWIASPAGIALALWLGLATTSVAYVLFGKGLSVLQPGHVATLNLMEPVVATALGLGVLGETLAAPGWLGCALILAALAALGLLERRSPAVPTGA